MTLQDLGNLGDFIGGLAVIATLIYLAIQIRQNTRMLRTSGEHFWDPKATIGLLAQSPENAAVYYKGLFDFDALSPEERTHFYLFLAAIFYHFQQGYTANKAGIQTEDSWTAQWRALQFYAAQPSVRIWWARQGGRLFDPEAGFRKLTDSEMRKHDGPAVGDGAASTAAPGARPDAPRDG